MISIKLSDIDFSDNKIKVFGKGKKRKISSTDIIYLKI